MKLRNRLRLVSILLLLAGITGVSYGQFSREGPASGGGFEASGDVSSQEMSSTDFRRQNCKDNQLVIGRTNYYNCGGVWVKKEYVHGKMRYLIVSAPI